MRETKIKNTLIVIFIILISFIINAYKDEIYKLYTNVFNIKSYTIKEALDSTSDSYVVINDNNPKFDEINTKSFEKYDDLDILGRAKRAYANVSESTMPKEKRESIGMIKPSAWHTIKYDNIDGKFLYNRCHLIGYQLTGENKNEKNLITCTRQMNTGVMLEYENKVASYIKRTHNHVLYRVTPIYKDTELLARGVQMEGYSIEDNGKGIKFNIFVYNKQDGIEINYKDGTSRLKSS